MLKRCEWCLRDQRYMDYHDLEWGVPVHDDIKLFEFLLLEGAQAGLSWYTVLSKREAYREAYDQFDVEKVARYGQSKIEELMQNANIIRNRLKIESSVKNAQAFLSICDEFGSFDQYIWRFVDGEPIQNQWRVLSELPAETPLSATISKDLKKRGFNFVGPTIVYSHLQATGMVNDHLIECFRFSELGGVIR